MKARCIIFWICLLANLAKAQNVVQYIGIDHGLSNNAVTSICQDQNGFMWFGTYDGLNRYDGYSFKVFRNKIGDSTSLGDNHVSAIGADASHNLWVGCEKGAYLYNPISSKFLNLRFRSFNGNIHEIREAVPSICPIANGKHMLVGALNSGLLFFENGRTTGIRVSLWDLREETGYSVTAIAYDPHSGRAWVHVQNVGLCLYDTTGYHLRVVNTSIKAADCLKVDSKGGLWLGNENGLFAYNTASNTFSSNILPTKMRVIQLFEDARKVLWIASDGGGVWSMPLDTHKASPYLSPSGSPQTNSNAVYCIYDDNKGRKWIGTLRGGINLIQPFRGSFKTVTYNPVDRVNPVNNFILSFCDDEKGNVWIGTDGAGLRYWDRGKDKYVQYVHNPADPGSLSSNFVTGIFRESGGDLWVSTWFGGVNRLRTNGKGFEHFSLYNPKTASEEHNAWLVYEDSQKNLWAGSTNNGTLYLFNRTSNRFEQFDDRIINLQCLAEDSRKNLWGGNYTSLILIDRANKKHIFYNIGYTVRCILEDKRGNMWVGTDGGGLLLFDRSNGSFRRFTTTEGLPSNSILRMLEDPHGNLWLSTYNGLSKFNTLEKTFRNFSQSDGLQSNQFSFNAGLTLRTGEFLFGGIKGFNVFYPDSVYDKKEMNSAFLTGLKINNVPVEENDSYVTKRELETIQEVTLPFDEAILSLDFVALAYTGAEKIKYAYRLEGWDKHWNYVNDIRTANYSRLQEGDYRFQIKFSNSDGFWSPETELLRIVVLPPWYRTWWAYLLFVLAVGSSVYLYIVYNKRQERLKYEVKLAHLENEKEKELIGKKLTFFTHISHEFRTPLTLILNPLKEYLAGDHPDNDRREISVVYRNARRLLSLVDQLLLFRKVESVDQDLCIERFNIIEACNEVYLSFGQHAVSKNIRFRFERPGAESWIYGDREKIDIILFNLLSNAFKYTHAGGQIILEIIESEQDVCISVKDTGCGINEEAGSRLFGSFYQVNNKVRASQTGFGIGLYVSQRLAEAHGGKIGFTSRVGEGSEFYFSLKKGKAHFSIQPISEECQTKLNSPILDELIESATADALTDAKGEVKSAGVEVIDKLVSDLPTMVIIDDDAELRGYISMIFNGSFQVYEADDGDRGYELLLKTLPDIVISDVMMRRIGGIELCRAIKSNPSLAHIPVILLTASTSEEVKLQGIEGGAEDYITKPFHTGIIKAKVQNILKGRNRLQQYFFNAVTLKPTANPGGEHKEFIQKCISIVEDHLGEPEFTIQTFCREIGMSHPSLYKKVKAVSGLTVNVFIRYIRLRKAAELLITTDKTIAEITYLTGFNDIRYFREQFFEVFNMKPSDYVRQYRKVLGKKTPNY